MNNLSDMNNKINWLYNIILLLCFMQTAAYAQNISITTNKGVKSSKNYQLVVNSLHEKISKHPKYQIEIFILSLDSGREIFSLDQNNELQVSVLEFGIKTIVKLKNSQKTYKVEFVNHEAKTIQKLLNLTISSINLFIKSN
jgi:hypothetical protein